MGRENNQNENTIEFIDIQLLISDVIKCIKRLWWVFPILAAFLSVIMCAKEIKSYVPMYKASATFTITVQSSSASSTGGDDVYSYYYNSSTASQMAATFPYILSSDVFMEVLKEDLGVSFINGTISAAAISDSNMFTLSVTSTNPEDAYNILISAIENYPAIAQYVIGDSQMNMQIPPNIPTEPANGITFRSAVKLSILAALCIVGAVVFVLATTRNTVRTKKDIKYKLNQNQLGTIAKVKFKRHASRFNDSITVLNPRIPEVFKESMRVIRIRTLKETKAAGNVIMVTSTLPNEGKSTVSVNLAIEIAKQGKNVALVDGDFRNPTIRNIIGIKGENGDLTKIIEEKKDNFVLEKDAKTGLYVLGCAKGLSNPSVKINSSQMKYVIKCLKKEMDYVIIDTPPCGPIADASMIARLADGIIYVIRQDYVKINHIMNAMQSLSYSKTKILGCVLNVAESGMGGYGYSAYGYGYGYGRYGSGSYGYGASGRKKEKTKK